jgi:hypothetical protein
MTDPICLPTNFPPLGVVSVHETKETVDVKTFLSQFENFMPEKMDEIMDVFNEKIDYSSFKTWKDVNRLHNHFTTLIINDPYHQIWNVTGK